ncbi:DUF6009 family protein [Kitasatospora sp. NPDC057904]|uniref:DUF6009 family protein n=1 Tax=Kitasatospora sp. NPDC057904 TaxID=3346275 RepID=UPI0036DDBA5A
MGKFDYVRDYLEVAAGARSGPVRWNGHGRRVEYSVLKPDAPAGKAPFRFARRVFWIKEHDRSERPDGVYKDCAPSEGVDPAPSPPECGVNSPSALGKDRCQPPARDRPPPPSPDLNRT